MVNKIGEFINLSILKTMAKSLIKTSKKKAILSKKKGIAKPAQKPKIVLKSKPLKLHKVKPKKVITKKELPKKGLELHKKLDKKTLPHATLEAQLPALIHPVAKEKRPVIKRVEHLKPEPAPSSVVIQKDADICMLEGCEETKTTGDYCRYHYISKWKRLKKKERVLAEKRLNKYIEELTSRYPDEYLEVIKKDLSTDKNFAELLQDLEIEDVDDVAGHEEEDDDDFSKKFRPEEEEF